MKAYPISDSTSFISKCKEKFWIFSSKNKPKVIKDFIREKVLDYKKHNLDKIEIIELVINNFDSVYQQFFAEISTWFSWRIDEKIAVDTFPKIWDLLFYNAGNPRMIVKFFIQCAYISIVLFIEEQSHYFQFEQGNIKINGSRFRRTTIFLFS